MRGLLVCGWLLLPILAGAYHFGPGIERLAADHAGDSAAQARQCVEQQKHAEAVAHFSDALEQLPADRVAEHRQLRLERAKSRLLAQQLPAAYDELTLLAEELQSDSATDPALLADTQNALASAKYYLTWLMRLEGEPRDQWEPEIEGARQLYRQLAENAEQQGKVSTAAEHQQDLEAAIRLARLDLSELQALPLPSQCKGCCSGQCQCKGKCKSKGKKPGGNKPEDARGAGSGPPPDGKGN